MCAQRKKAKKICVAFDNMDSFFPAANIIKTGNPVRKTVIAIEGKKEEASTFFKLDINKKTVLVVGGSLGSRTLNNSMIAGLKQLESNNIQLIWQTGKVYFYGTAHGQVPITFQMNFRLLLKVATCLRSTRKLTT